MNSIIEIIEELKLESPVEDHAKFDRLKERAIKKRKELNEYKKKYYHENIEKQREYQRNYIRNKRKLQKEINEN